MTYEFRISILPVCHSTNTKTTRRTKTITVLRSLRNTHYSNTQTRRIFQNKCVHTLQTYFRNTIPSIVFILFHTPTAPSFFGTRVLYYMILLTIQLHNYITIILFRQTVLVILKKIIVGFVLNFIFDTLYSTIRFHNFRQLTQYRCSMLYG